MKRGATALLVFAAVVFILIRIFGPDATWAGYVEAAAEAAMVGGLADWFAVTALFKHPLGLPIPHTAIIPTRKNEIGQSLGDFVQDNFLDADTLTDRLSGVGIGSRLGGWLAELANSVTVGEQAGAVVAALSGVLADEEIQGGIEQAVSTRVRAMPVTPLVGKAIDLATAQDHHQTLFDTALRGIDRVLYENDARFRQLIKDESPKWVPGAVDDVVYDKIVDVATKFLHDVIADPDHQLRDLLDERTVQLADQMKQSPEMAERGERLKEELLDHPEIREWIAGLWATIKSQLVSATNDPDSELRKRLESATVTVGEALQDDPVLQAKVDAWALGATRYVAQQSKGEVASLIATTVESWDAEETSERIEQQVGRDLQFIRINGTLVGGVAGLVIHAIGQIFIG